jgi:hypothetical protein
MQKQKCKNKKKDRKVGNSHRMQVSIAVIFVMVQNPTSGSDPATETETTIRI